MVLLWPPEATPPYPLLEALGPIPLGVGVLLDCCMLYWYINIAAVQVVRGLPESVLASVLRTSATPLPVQLSMLPQAYHQLAVHAAFPSILDDRSINLEYRFLQDDVAVAVCPCLHKVTSLQLRGVARSIKTLALHLTSLTASQQLDLRGNKLCAEVVRTLGPISPA